MSGELSKAQTNAVAKAALANVPREILVASADAIAWFGDRPQSSGVDVLLSAQKLAFHAHRMGMTQADIAECALRLDERVTFAPTVADWIAEFEALQARRRDEKWRKARVRVIDGKEFVVFEEDDAC